MQDHQPQTDRTTNDSSPKLSNCKTYNDYDRRFESYVEKLKVYIETHSHMNIAMDESNASLYNWISRVRISVKSIQKGQTPHLKITPDRMRMLQEIGFQFERKRQLIVPFGSRIEALRLYREKHGHMNVTKKEDKSLWKFIVNIRYSVKKIQDGQTPRDKITPNRMRMLQEIGFDFEGRGSHQSFESRIEALRLYRAKHGHMNVSEKEDKSLWKFTRNVENSLKRMQEGKKPLYNITPDRITALEAVGFNVGPMKRGRNSIAGTPSTTCTSSKCQRVEERLYTKQEEVPMSGICTDENKSEDTEEIEGDIVPRWLISDEDEEDNGDSLLDEISIEVDGETEVKNTKYLAC